MERQITVIQGGQYGSEAKGAIAGALALKRQFTAAVRTGAINAGHTVYYNGTAYKMQQLPVAWVNPHTKLIIGPGAYIHRETLQREIDMINLAMPGADVRNRLHVDYRCTLHTLADEQMAKNAGRHTLIGATGKGCAEAIISKIDDRGRIDLTAKDLITKDGVDTCDTVALMGNILRQHGTIMVEGTQGSLLDLHQGPWPYTTSRMTTAANWIAEAGLPVTVPIEVIMVMRTMPIRVAGNSGPLPYETTWPNMMRQINTRLGRHNLPPMVSEDHIREYEDRVLDVASARFLPWCLKPQVLTPEQRVEFASDLSNCYSQALMRLPDTVVAGLLKLMELSTVTMKPRRIADFSWGVGLETINKERPTSVALTFLNYWHPEIWGAVGPDIYKYGDAAARTVEDAEKNLGAPISAISTGPLPEHVLWRDNR
jgi:adenylosuccinate synthase